MIIFCFTRSAINKIFKNKYQKGESAMLKKFLSWLISQPRHIRLLVGPDIKFNWTIAVLLASLILAIFDGVATYIEISKDLLTELNPLLPTFIQTKYGLENWLVFHIILFTVFAVMLAVALWKKYRWPIYFWFAVEVLLLIIHVRILIFGGF